MSTTALPAVVHPKHQQVNLRDSSSYPKCRTKLEEFLSDSSTRLEHISALISFLEARPRCPQPTSYIEALETRLDLLRDVRKSCEAYLKATTSFPAVTWAFLLVVPLDRLRLLRDELSSCTACLSFQFVDLTIPMKLFLTKRLTGDQLGTVQLFQPNKKRTRVPRIQTQDIIEQKRDQNEKAKCIRRDRRCVVTGAANPDICHVFPYAAKIAQAETQTALVSLIWLWSDAIYDRIKRLLLGDNNIIDTAPNMVALSPLLHRWWGMALFGLEPVEKIEKGIRLRFRWLKRTGLRMREPTQLDADPLQVFLPPPVLDADGIVAVHRTETGRPIVDGEIVDITAEDESAVPNWDLFSLQWDLIRMASLCGAAEDDKDGDVSDDDSDGSDTMDVDSETWLAEDF